MPPDNPVVSGLDASAAAAVSPPASDTPKPPPPMDAATSASSLSSEVEKAAQENGIPSGIFHAQALRESHFNPTARSPKGAEGVMQLMPRTAAELGVNSDDPVENIHGGAKYMKKLHDQFGSWDKALAAYDWGPHNVHEASVAHGENWLDDAPDETKKYVKNILEHPVVGPVQTAPAAGADKEKPEPAAAEPSLAERVWTGAKNLATTGSTTGHPKQDAEAFDRQLNAQQSEHEGEAQYKDFLYKNKPDEFKKAYPVDYLARRAHEIVVDAAVGPAVQGMSPEQRAYMEPKIKEVADLGASLYGVPQGGGVEPVIKEGIALPEGGLEGEGMEAEIPQSGNLASIPGAIQVKAAPKIGALENVPGAIKIKPAAVEMSVEGPQWERTVSGKMGDVPAGKVGYKVDPSGKAQIYGAVVHPELRGQGLGTKLYKTLIEDARAGGVHEITSDSTNTSAGAKRVWQKLGEQGYPVEEITHANGKPGYRIDLTPQAMEAAGPFTSPQEAVEAAGGIFRGQNKDGLVEITLPRSMTDKLALEDRMKPFVSVTMPASEVTPEAVKAAMDAKFKQFGGKQESAPFETPAQQSEPISFSPGIHTVKHGDATLIYQVKENGETEISSIRVPQSKRGQGSAKAVLQKFTDAADKENLHLRLIASPLDKKTSTAGLIDLYKKFGFEETGETANPVGDPWMERKSRPQTEQAQSEPSSN